MSDISLYKGTETILLIDDEQMITDILKRILSRLGYVVHAFINPEEAMALYLDSPQNIDLIITDMNMPGLSGIDLAKKVKAQDSSKPIILCSGFTTENDIQQAMEAGINSVLKKPTETIDLLKNIRKIFNQQSKSVQ